VPTASSVGSFEALGTDLQPTNGGFGKNDHYMLTQRACGQQTSEDPA
jgi:hypothetical protein